MTVATCPDCERKINLGPDPEEGQRVTCSNCKADLEVISLTPPELDWYYSESDEYLEDSDDKWD